MYGKMGEKRQFFMWEVSCMVPRSTLTDDLIAKFGEKDEKVVHAPSSEWHPVRRYYFSPSFFIKVPLRQLCRFYTPIPPNSGVHLPTSITLVHHNGLYGFRFKKATTSMLSGIEPAEAKSSTAISPELGAFVNVAKPGQQAQAPDAAAVAGPNETAAGTANKG